MLRGKPAGWEHLRQQSVLAQPEKMIISHLVSFLHCEQTLTVLLREKGNGAITI